MNDEWIKVVSSLGFPIAVTIWLLWERRSLIALLTAKLSELTAEIRLLREAVGSADRAARQKD